MFETVLEVGRVNSIDGVISDTLLRKEALETFLKTHDSFIDSSLIAGCGSIFDVEGMMFYVLRENEIEETVRKVTAGFIQNANLVEMCPKKYLARFDQKENQVKDFFIYRMV